MMLQMLLFDNPILVKHLRARLRRQHLLSWIIIVVILAACIAWSGLAHSPLTESSEEISQARMLALAWLLALQAAILFLGGTAQVAGSIMQARESGLIDFHRVSPQHPAAMALGFTLGAPIREYILFACILPFAMVLVAMEGGLAGAGGLLLTWLAMLVAAFLYQTLALFFGLILPKGRGIGALVVVLVFILHMLWQASPFACFLTALPAAFLHLFATLVAESPDDLQISFFGLHLPAVLTCLLHQLPLTFFLFLAAVRKMRHERTFAFARPVALLFFAVLAVLIVGDVIIPFETKDLGSDALAYAAITIFFGLLGLGALLVTAVTPNAAEFIKGVRHARKLGRVRPSRWDDMAANWVPVLCVTAILLLVCTAASLYMPREHFYADGYVYAERYGTDAVSWKILTLLMATGISAAVLVFFGLAKQAFSFLFHKNGAIYFGLTLFALWIVPLLFGAVAAMTGDSDSVRDVLMSISPLSGIVQLIVDPLDENMLTLLISLAELVGGIVLYIIGMRAIMRQFNLAEEKPVDAPPAPVTAAV